MLARKWLRCLLIGIILCLPSFSSASVSNLFLLSSKLPPFSMEDAALEMEDTCWQSLFQGVANSDPRLSERRLVFTLNQNLADISSAKVLPGLKRLGITALFLVDSSSIISNEYVLRNIVEQGHYVALKNLSKDTSREDIMEDVMLYYRVLEREPLFIAQRVASTAPLEVPTKMIPIYVGENDGRNVFLEREGDLDDAISQEKSSFTKLEKIMKLDQLRCTYQRLGCHSRLVRESIFSKWCTNLEEELISRYVNFAQYVSSHGNITSHKVRDWLSDVHFFIDRNSEKLESLYEGWRYADIAAEPTSVIHLWPKRRIPPTPCVNSTCFRNFLKSSQHKGKWNQISSDVHLLTDITILLISLILFYFLRRKYLVVKKQE